MLTCFRQRVVADGFRDRLRVISVAGESDGEQEQGEGEHAGGQGAAAQAAGAVMTLHVGGKFAEHGTAAEVRDFSPLIVR